MPYRPCPVDTSSIELPLEITALVELLAQNNHEVWAQARQREGWKYGRERNDGRKESPCMVPYEDLPESEKEYDRQAAVETLKVILSLGYRITR